MLYVKISGQIKETLSIELSVPIGKQELKGWDSRRVTDNVNFILYKQQL